ncbi:MAG: malto-oligosyltrehalose trehalohydrolase [Acidobacteria bacterium]|nr:malto-oligosyltrehalose trehalohydrolase [Acidobacteriota bacterium]
MAEAQGGAVKRRRPVGAEVIDGRVHVRLWAHAARRVEVVLADTHVDLAREGAGYFSGWVPARAGDRYRFRLDGSDRLYPDPASCYQPDGPHQASRIVDHAAYTWHDRSWPGVSLEGQVIYELHIGTFTSEGTWRAAARELEELARLGITLVEMMPVAEFDGRFGWGYDGVDLFAPYHGYGAPDDLRAFVDRAHRCGLGVLLDVVYNHFGPSGNYLRAFSPAYFTERHANEWGDALNFDGDHSGPVRELFASNACYWIDEFHFDGLRVDATQQIFDASREHILATISREARKAAGARRIVLVAENERQDVRVVAPLEVGGYGFDALWNDDFHHCATVASHGRAEAYYSDTRGEPQELISAAKYGYLFQGQYYRWQRAPRGTPALDLAPARFVAYLQNHDQVANSARGLRGHLLASPGRWRALTALLLLLPATPMLFQGQEFCSSAPFLYFADFDRALMRAVSEGRSEFLAQFPSMIDYLASGRLDDPSDPRTLERCRLDFTERQTHAAAYALHRDLLALRRETAAFRRQQRGGIDGAVLASSAFALRFFGETSDDDRLLLVNLGTDLERGSLAEPLVAPPSGREWWVAWSSEAPAYGGLGTPARMLERGWCIPGEAAIVLAPRVRQQPPPAGTGRRTA